MCRGHCAATTCTSPDIIRSDTFDSAQKHLTGLAIGANAAAWLGNTVAQQASSYSCKTTVTAAGVVCGWDGTTATGLTQCDIAAATAPISAPGFTAGIRASSIPQSDMHDMPHFNIDMLYISKQ